MLMQELGNNAQLAQLMGWQHEYSCGEQNLLNIGSLPQPQTLTELAQQLQQQLKRVPVVVGEGNRLIQKTGMVYRWRTRLFRLM